MELYQAEWCPYSHRVRQRLTELQLDFCALQVPVRPDDRQDMREAVGENSIPVLVDGDEVLSGDEAILTYLNETYPEPADATEHRAKARAEVRDFDEVAGR